MCLIHTIKPDTRISTAWLRNIYQKNSDGLGAMLFIDGQMVVKKYLPKNFKRALRWFRREVEGHGGVVHWRFATHGDVNLDNAHPYTVLTKEEDGIDMVLMHNGVMGDWDASSELDDMVHGHNYFRGRFASLGRRKDDDRSDTFHFIRCVIQPLVKPSLGGDPRNIRNKVVQTLIAAQIGDGNKLVIMDGEGEVIFINGQEFVEWDVYGLHCSNTYAWDYSSRKLEEPDVRDRSAGDPRKVKKGGTVLTYGTIGSALPTNPQSRFYENEIVPLGWDKIEADEDSRIGIDDTTFFQDKQQATQWWSDLNTVFGSVAAELSVIDIANYIHVEGEREYQDNYTDLCAGVITDKEFVDIILDVASLARMANVA